MRYEVTVHVDVTIEVEADGHRPALEAAMREARTLSVTRYPGIHCPCKPVGVSATQELASPAERAA